MTKILLIINFIKGVYTTAAVKGMEDYLLLKNTLSLLIKEANHLIEKGCVILIMIKTIYCPKLGFVVTVGIEKTEVNMAVNLDFYLHVGGDYNVHALLFPDTCTCIVL